MARAPQRSAGIDVGGLLARSNRGVEARDARDKAALQTPATQAAQSYAALEQKAALYDKLARGELDDNEERYEVDFLRKGDWCDAGPSGQRHGDGQEAGPAGRPAAAAAAGAIDSAGEAVLRSRGLVSSDMEQERQRRSWEEEELRRHAQVRQEAGGRRPLDHWAACTPRCAVLHSLTADDGLLLLRVLQLRT